MNVCQNCGAALDATPGPSVCKFCNVANAAPPPERLVPVPVQIVHQTVQVVGGPETAARELKCPQCRVRLVTAQVAEVALHGCGRCGGIWLDNASARAVVTSPQRVFADLADRAGKNARAQAELREARFVPCPHCEGNMRRVPAHGLTVDVCDEHGTWFDPFELKHVVERLIALATPKPAGPATVKCVRCSGSVPIGRANITGDGPECDTCWRAHQERLLHESNGRHLSAVAHMFVTPPERQ